jgi:hypothetical protein
MVSLVNSQGTWTPATSRSKNKIENPGPAQQEQIKNRKHTDFYAPNGFAFFPFVVSFFGFFGPTAVRCLFAYSLADLEARQYESLLNRQGLPPVSCQMLPAVVSSSRSCCRQGFRYAHPLCAGVPCLPLPQPILSAFLARNCPGPADSFSPPAPRT